MEAIEEIHEGEWLKKQKEIPAEFKQMADLFRVRPKEFAKWIAWNHANHWLDGNMAQLVKYGNITWDEMQTAFNLPYNELGSTVFPSTMEKLEQIYGGGIDTNVKISKAGARGGPSTQFKVTWPSKTSRSANIKIFDTKSEADAFAEKIKKSL